MSSEQFPKKMTLIDLYHNQKLEDNLITTCNQCNLRANINRDHWQEYYSKKVAIV